jgi:hypothetical protein
MHLRRCRKISRGKEELTRKLEFILKVHSGVSDGEDRWRTHYIFLEKMLDVEKNMLYIFVYYTKFVT